MERRKVKKVRFKFKMIKSKFKKIKYNFKKIKCNFKHEPVSATLNFFRRKFEKIKSNLKKKTFKSNFAETCSGVEMGGRGAEAYQPRYQGTGA